MFEAFAKEQHVPGLIYGIVDGGRPARLRAIGVQDLDSKRAVSADTAFPIASMTKSFLALAVLKLRDEGRLRLSDPVKSAVPELRVLAPQGLNPQPITIRELLTHSAGFVTDDPWADRQMGLTEVRFLDLLRQGIPLAQAPGEAFEYSNLGYALLGLIVTRKSGLPYQDYITKTILLPLGMSATRWTNASAGRVAVGYSWVDDHWEAQPPVTEGAFSAAAGLLTTANDYLKFVAWVLATWGSKVDAAGVMKPASLREAGRGAIFSQVGARNRPGGATDCPVAWEYGYGFYVVTDCELGTMLRHPGGLPGFGAQVLLLPRDQVGMFAFANVTYAHLVSPIVDAAAKLRQAALLQPQQEPLSPALRRAAGAIEKMYRLGDVTIDPTVLAQNLLRDSPATRRNDELREDNAALGSCRPPVPVEIRHALAAKFTLVCEHGTLIATVLLAPTPETRIQYLSFVRAHTSAH